jgi:hypothetical protein
MKSTILWVLVLSLTLLFQMSCEESSDCELNDYALPEIELMDLEDSIIVWSYQGSYPQVRLLLKAEAGLNTLAMEDPYGYQRPIKAFTSGETDLDYTFELRDFYESETVFVLHDLCNQRAEVEARIVFEQAPAK